MQPTPRFADVIKLDEWQKIQDTFSSMTSIGIRTLDADGKVLARSGSHPFFKNACVPTFLGGDSVVDKNLSFVCPSGFHNFVSPLRYCDSGKVLAYIILGPVVLVMRRPKEDYKKLKEDLSFAGLVSGEFSLNQSMIDAIGVDEALEKGEPTFSDLVTF